MSKMISPKPWRIDHLRSLDMRAQITDKNGNIICSAYYHTRLKHNNAHLIAAAPELLEACEAIIDCPYDIDQASVPKAGIDAAPPYQVVGAMSVSYTKYQKLNAAIAAAKGDK